MKRQKIMKHAAELYNKLKALTKGDDDILPAVVKSVEDDGTVTVEFDGYAMAGCRIQSVSGEAKGIKIKPTVESIVLLKRIGDTNEFFVCLYSEVDEQSITIGNKIYKLNSFGHLIKGGDDTLKEVLTLIIEAVQVIVVLYGNNPDFVKLEQALTKANNILQ